MLSRNIFRAIVRLIEVAALIAMTGVSTAGRNVRRRDPYFAIFL
jgi:hypothetical protein